VATIARTRTGLPLPLTIFSGAAITMAPVAAAIQIAQAGQTELAGAVHDACDWGTADRSAGLAGIGADRLDADAEHVAIGASSRDARASKPGLWGPSARR
jgi:hypothetical protein